MLPNVVEAIFSSPFRTECSTYLNIIRNCGGIRVFSSRMLLAGQYEFQ